MNKLILLLLLILTSCSNFKNIKVNYIDLETNSLQKTNILISKTDSGVPPQKKELLKPLIKLTNYCKNVYIVEWRKKEKLNKTDLAKHVDNICNKAVIYFPHFMQKYLSPVEKDILKSYDLLNFSYTYPEIYISILPYEYMVGKNKRNLNDLFRFKEIGPNCITLNKFKCSNEPLTLIGLFLYSNNYQYVFIGPSVSNNRFDRIFLHEMHHALSKQSKFSESLTLRRSEELAEQFAKILTKQIID
jgi:hypothetical protein